MTETVSRPAVLFMADEFDENAKVSRADNKLFSAQEWGYLAARLRALPATDTAECERLREAQNVVNEQAENEALWATPMFASEAFLQQQLRRLHAAIEGKTPDECGMTALKDQGNG